jgi:hypothetical protein
MSAAYVTARRKAGLAPGELDLGAVRTVGSTGSPLDADGFDWLTDNLGERVQIVSFSGGTDLCTGIVGGAPTVPVWKGEISCRALGARVESYSDTGEPVLDRVGELVITAPMPSMPVWFRGDPDGTRLQESSFDHYPGVWRHGDWIRITDRGSCIIKGRSDATLNRGGIRMGTAEFYRIVESLPQVTGSLVSTPPAPPAKVTCCSSSSCPPTPTPPTQQRAACQNPFRTHPPATSPAKSSPFLPCLEPSTARSAKSRSNESSPAHHPNRPSRATPSPTPQDSTHSSASPTRNPGPAHLIDHSCR